MAKKIVKKKKVTRRAPAEAAEVTEAPVGVEDVERRRPGRPPSGERKYSRHVAFGVTETEYADLKEAAWQDRRSVAQLIRQRLGL